MTASPLRVAILGMGMIAEVYRRTAPLNGAQVVAALSATPERTQETALRW